jgi:CRISPR/Cas system CSM-associated protein Csm2 small subunit
MYKPFLEVLLTYLKDQRDEIEKEGLIATMNEAISRVEEKIANL